MARASAVPLVKSKSKRKFRKKSNQINAAKPHRRI
jgi:hypothetical protein